jgi:uncharacterized protein (DUF1697 family)
MAPLSGPCVALLRGINVGRAKRIAMADLRALVERLGGGGVRTLLNSGNIVFTPPRGTAEEIAARIGQAIQARLQVATRVTVLDGREVAEAVRRNPLAAVASDPSRFLVLVPRTARDLPRLKPLLEERFAPEVLALGRRVAYLWCAEGVRDSALWKAVDKVLGEEGTARNMTTMTKLLEMVEAS